MYLAKREIGLAARPFIIAEMSGNHNQSLERALEIVSAAANTGVDAIKIQTYTADTMTLNIEGGDFYINDEKSLWAGKSLYRLYQEAHTPWEWHKPIFEHAQKLGLLCFSTPFDESAVDFLESLNVPFYKIASFENTDIPLIKKVAGTGKPIIMSCGMATVAEIDDSVRAAREAGCRDLILLKCTSTYPASAENSNIKTVAHMRELFDCEIGLSDHTLGVGVAVAAVSLGATVIEKHFTLNRADGGVDSVFSMEPAEMSMLVTESNQAWQALGTIRYGATSAEKKSIAFRRSLYIATNIKAGDILTRENLRAVRPGFGLPPKYIEHFLGKKVNRIVKMGTPVSWELLG